MREPDPFEGEEELSPPLHPLSALRHMQELLDMIVYWRERAEDAEYELRARELARRRKLRQPI